MTFTPSSPDVTADLAEVMAAVAKTLETTEGLGNTLQTIVHLAVGTIPGADHASVSKVRRKGIETVVTTDDLPPQVDEVQYRTGEGPCVEAVWSEPISRLDDTSSGERWPEFSRGAAELGVGSLLSFQLSLEEDTSEPRIGALNLYADVPHAFGADSERVGAVFAAHATVALATAEREHQLQEALEARDLIGQAKGMIMARFGLDADRAFGVLVRLSRDSNTKLRDVAVRIVSGQLDPGQRRSS